MLKFILGALVGGIVGFAACAICSMAGFYDDTETPKKSGDSDATSK